MKKKVEREIAELHEKSKKEQQSRVKLPKLVILRFQGTHIDWRRVWSKFETEIDKSDIPQVTKVSYLKEAVVFKVRSTIDGLPLTTEGYECAKQIFENKIWKTQRGSKRTHPKYHLSTDCSWNSPGEDSRLFRKARN